MRRSPRYAFALALLSVLSLALFFPSTPSSAKGPSPDPVCVSICQQRLYECFLENGTDEHRCIAAYRGCMGRCK